jgi:carboxypeptidase T
MIRRIASFFSSIGLAWALPLGAFLPVGAVGGPTVSPPTAASDPLPLYEVDLTTPDALHRLGTLGVDLLELGGGRKARVLGWPGMHDELRASGLLFREISQDYGRDLALRQEVTPSRPVPSAPGTGWNVPPFGQGSMAGFWSLAEVDALLDSIAATDPLGIVGSLETIGTSVEGRPIHALVVTDLSRPLGTRPAVFYNALTHAREPAGMQALLYFLSGLIQGYGTDPEITYLVREREMWFVPVVNPDGYESNYNTWLQTGAYGMVRKNSHGVDLNRNFGYAWGYDNVGSSSKHGAETYRGPAPFSEPETQALRDFCIAKDFVTAENIHTFGELCLYPWSDIYPGAPDSSDFIRLADARMQGVGYRCGQSTRILYSANGVATDWMYGENILKPATLAMSTEAGNIDDEFWPPPARILPLAALQFHSNLVLAYAAGPYVMADSLVIDSPSGALAPGEGRLIRFRLRNEGVAGTGEALRVTVIPGHPLVTASVSEVDFSDVASGDAGWPTSGSACFLSVDPSCVPGTRVPLLLAISGNHYEGRDTLEFRVGPSITLFADQAGSGLGNWAAQGTWGVELVGGNPVFSVSPGAPYPQHVNMSLTLNPGLDLSNAANAALRFRTRWDIEEGMDFGRIEGSLDGGVSWIPLRGKHMLLGHGTQGSYQYGTQTDGQSGYFATQRHWMDEDVDLAPLLGHTNVRLRFRLTSDLGKTGDGWWIDDVVVLAYAALAPVGVADGQESIPLLSVTPNPTSGVTRIRFMLPEPGPTRVAIYDLGGRQVRVLSEGFMEAGERMLIWDGFDALGNPVSSGAYFVRLGGSTSLLTKILVMH